MNKKINTIVFDLYETIIFPKKGLKPAPLQAFINTFNYYLPDKSYDNKMFIDIVNKNMGHSKRKHLSLILEYPYLTEFNKYLTKNNITQNQVYNKFIDVQCELLENPDYCVLADNYHKTIEELQKIGIKNICATTGFNYLQASIILHHNPNLKLGKIITTDNVKKPRPAPDGIHKIMNKYDIYDYNVIKIGDTIADIQEAHNAKVISIGITTGSVLCEEFKANNAEYVISNIDELPELVKNINKNYF
jgi:phosphoglycolate phosphatase-like HAD superfamily hydrolase